MKYQICIENKQAEEQLDPKVNDRSGIGVHYMDKYIKPMNVTLDEGPAVSCKRRGLKVTLKVGDRKGEGIMRRLELGPDPIAMLRAALQEAAKAAEVELSFEDGAIFVTV